MKSKRQPTPSIYENIPSSKRDNQSSGHSGTASSPTPTTSAPTPTTPTPTTSAPTTSAPTTSASTTSTPLLCTSTPTDSNLSLSFNRTISTINNDLSLNIRSKQSEKKDITDDIKTAYRFLLSDGSKEILKKKLFKVDNNEHYKTLIYNFFDSKTEFKEWPTSSVEFTCIICYGICTEKLNHSTNLMKHLKKHNSEIDNTLAVWFTEYKNQKQTTVQKEGIDENTLELVKYFISSNTALKELNNVHLLHFMRMAGLKMPCSKTFKNKIMPEVIQKVKNSINSK